MRRALIRNMSTTGALLVADTLLAKTGNRQAVSVSIEAAEASKGLAFTAVVRNIKVEPAREKGGPNLFLHGVEFLFSDAMGQSN